MSVLRVSRFLTCLMNYQLLQLSIFSLLALFTFSFKVSGAENTHSIPRFEKIGARFFDPHNWYINDVTGMASTAFPLNANSEGTSHACIISLDLSHLDENQALEPRFSLIPMPQNTKRIVIKNLGSEISDVYFFGRDFFQFNTVSSTSILENMLRLDKAGKYGDSNFLECSPKRFGNKLAVAFGGKSISTVVQSTSGDLNFFSQFSFEDQQTNLWRPVIIDSDERQSMVVANSVSQQNGAFAFQTVLVRLKNDGSSELLHHLKENTRIAGSAVSTNSGKDYLLLLKLLDDSKIEIGIAEILGAGVTLKQLGSAIFQDADATAYMFLPWSITSSGDSLVVFPLPNLKFAGKFDLSDGKWSPKNVVLPKDASVVTAFYKNEAINVITGVPGKLATNGFPRLTLHRFQFIENE